jgi:septal ring factor EnvC (AmiA/AmiB activator)
MEEKKISQKLSEIQKEIDKLKEAVGSIPNQIIEYQNKINELHHDIHELFELWRKREEENHLILVKLLEIHKGNLEEVLDHLEEKDEKPSVDYT